MSGTHSYTYRAALRAIDLAARILPLARRPWAQDMRNELAYVGSDESALRWAIGCVFASLSERLKSMNTSQQQISRPVLMLEWLMCFGPLTLLWFWAIRYAFTHTVVATDIILVAATATAAPIALLAAAFITLFESSAKLRGLFIGLAVIFGATLTLQLLSVGGNDLRWWQFDLSVFVLCSALPLAACIHLLFLARSPIDAGIHRTA